MPTTLESKASGARAASVTTAARTEMILDQFKGLPTLPAVAIRVLEVTSSDEAGARDVIRLIESDPALTTKVLRLLRRPSLGVRSGAATVERAVVLLGFEQVWAAVLSISVYDIFRGVEGESYSRTFRTEIWKHALAVACASRNLAQRLQNPKIPPDEAFVCGLLHDLGKFALEACLPKAYLRVLERAHKEHRSILELEREVLGVDHTVAGRRLLTRWGLPRTAIECAWLHHLAPEALPSSLGNATMIKVVHAADTLVRQLRIGFSGYLPIGVWDGCVRQLGLTAEAARDWSASVPAEFEVCASAFNIDALPTNATFVRALSTANAELGRVNARLEESRLVLTRRSRCLDSLRFFAGLLHADDPPALVCEKIAETTAMLFNTESAVVWASGCQPTLAASWDKARGGRSMRLPNGPAKPNDTPLIGAAAFRTAHPAEMDVYRQGTPLECPGALMTLPIRGAGREIGRMILPLSESAASEWNTSASDLDSLSLACGLALSQAVGKEQAERFQEELAEANRRLQAAQAELLHRKAVSMVAEMAAGAAHELNNPLAVIAGRAQMLTAECNEPETRRALEIISEQAKRASGIVSELMAFAKPQQPMPVPIKLSEFLEVLYRRWTEESSLTPDRFEIRLADTGVCVYADPAVLQEVFNALLANAVAAMDPASARLIINSPSLASDETVRIRIEDNGTGMEPEVLERAFDPFFSHRQAGRGRGMGLSRALRLIEIGGGKLSLESVAGVGTSVFLELPARAPGDQSIVA